MYKTDFENNCYSQNRDYSPGLNYIFVANNFRDIENHTPYYVYLNKMGLIPRIIFGNDSLEEDLRQQGVEFESADGLSGIDDIMLTSGMGYYPFERYWQYRFASRGGIVIQLNSLPLLYREPFPWLYPVRTPYIHVRGVSDRLNARYYSSYNNECLYCITGRAHWDQFSTDEFQRQVEAIRRQFGDKLLVLGVHDVEPEKETLFFAQVVDYAQAAGFRTVLQVHPSKMNNYKGPLAPYVNRDMNRYALFAAASHYLGYIHSSTTVENLMLGTAVGAIPLMAHHPQINQHSWIENTSEWHRLAHIKYGPETLDMVDPVYDLNSLKQFLTRTSPRISYPELERFMGWPRIRSCCSYTFEVLENLFSEESGRSLRIMSDPSGVIGSENFGKIYEKPKYYSESIHEMSFRHSPDGVAPPRAGEMYAGLMEQIENHLRREQYEPARGLIEQALMFTRCGEMPRLFFAMGLCQLARRNEEAARMNFYQAMRCNPTDANARQWYDRLSNNPHILQTRG